MEKNKYHFFLKEVLGTLFLFMLSIPIYSQENIMVVEGRKWVSCVLTMNGDNSWINRVEEIRGDTVINGKEYKKFYEDGVYNRALRENDRKVYEVIPGREEQIIYDFSDNSDVVPLSVLGDDPVQVLEIDTINVFGRDFARYRLQFYDNISDYLVEGIGCQYGPFNLVQNIVISSNVQYVRECYDGDELIFTDKDFGKPSIAGIDEVSSSSANASPKVYSADGKELDGLTKGLNIVKSADGKTVKVIR